MLALGGGTTEEIVRDIFEAVSVTRLPPPHNPAQCKHRDRFAPISAQHQAAGKDWFDADLEAGCAFLATLTPGDLRTCTYHQANWKAIAGASVRILENLGPREPKDYLAAAERIRLRRRDRPWLFSLFRDPIIIVSSSYTNGQHRGCALRFSGAERAVVVTGTESLGEENADWTYLGDG